MNTEPHHLALLPAEQRAQSMLPARSQPPSFGPHGEDPGAGPMIDLRGLWRAVKRRWWMPALSFSAFVAAGVMYLIVTPPKFRAVGELRVDQESPPLLKDATLQPVADFKNLDIMKSLEREAAGAGVLLSVAKKHGLAADPDFAVNPAGKPWNDDQVVLLMQKRVSAVLERGTRNIVVTVEDTDPKRARDICQSVIEEASRQVGSAGGERAEKVRGQLETERDRLKSVMELTRKAMDDFRAQHPTLPLDETVSDFRTNTFEDRLKAINAAAADAEAQRLRLSNAVAQVYAAEKDPAKLGQIAAIGQLEEVTDARKAFADEQKEFAGIDEIYGWKHEKWITGRKKLNERRASLDQAITNAAVSIVRKFQQAEEDVKRLGTERDRLNSEVNGFRKVFGDFQVLARTWKTDRDAYEEVIAGLKKAELDSTNTGSVLRIAEQPLLPSRPSSPNKKLVIGAAGALGMGLGLGIALMLHLLDRTLRNASDTEQALRLPALAVVPPDADAAALNADYFKEGKPSAAVGEAFRSLRTSLSILGGGTGVRSILLTSARPGDGVSYCAMNLAASFARQGFRTLLIDANLRAPVLDRILLNRHHPHGLAGMLAGTLETDSKACQPTSLQNLFLFCAGENTAHPGEMLHEQAFARLLQDASRWFHRIVIDTPAAGLFTDALLLARHADAVAVVVKAGSSRKDETNQVIYRLAQGGARVAGFVLNAAADDAKNVSSGGDFAANYRPDAAIPVLPAATS